MQYHKTVTDILDLLKKTGCWFETFEHQPVVTSEQAAKLRHGYSLSQGAKAIIVKIEKIDSVIARSPELAEGRRGNLLKSLEIAAPPVGGLAMTPESEFVMLVLPGDKKFSGSKVKKLLGVKELRFATPSEISELTGGIRIGGIPPFGNLFGIKVFVEKTLLDNEKIIFNAGDRSFSVAMKTEDYSKLVKPLVEGIV
jgi:prolyl-tRNA editing enzyme YbaK/EbsC (Cys-tRNA(Pro) deacylase)